MFALGHFPDHSHVSSDITKRVEIIFQVTLLISSHENVVICNLSITIHSLLQHSIN